MTDQEEQHALTIRLPEDIETHPNELARSKGRTKSFYVRQAIEWHLDDLEDIHLVDLGL